MTKDITLIGSFLKPNVTIRKMAVSIVEQFEVEKIFVFQVMDDETQDEEKFLFTFNVNNEQKDKLKSFKADHKNTIQLHRNKRNNVLFTINSLNALVRHQNPGIDEGTEKNFKIDWSKVKNSCLLLGKDETLKVLRIKLNDIIEL